VRFVWGLAGLPGAYPPFAAMAPGACAEYIQYMARTSPPPLRRWPRRSLTAGLTHSPTVAAAPSQPSWPEPSQPPPTPNPTAVHVLYWVHVPSAAPTSASSLLFALRAARCPILSASLCGVCFSFLLPQTIVFCIRRVFPAVVPLRSLALLVQLNRCQPPNCASRALPSIYSVRDVEIPLRDPRKSIGKPLQFGISLFSCTQSLCTQGPVATQMSAAPAQSQPRPRPKSTWSFVSNISGGSRKSIGSAKTPKIDLTETSKDKERTRFGSKQDPTRAISEDEPCESPSAAGNGRSLMISN
jgi:hypothetical protein